jgi:hypothetical protein
MPLPESTRRNRGRPGRPAAETRAAQAEEERRVLAALEAAAEPMTTNALYMALECKVPFGCVRRALLALEAWGKVRSGRRRFEAVLFNGNRCGEYEAMGWSLAGRSDRRPAP